MRNLGIGHAYARRNTQSCAIRFPFHRPCWRIPLIFYYRFGETGIYLPNRFYRHPILKKSIGCHVEFIVFAAAYRPQQAFHVLSCNRCLDSSGSCYKSRYALSRTRGILGFNCTSAGVVAHAVSGYADFRLDDIGQAHGVFHCRKHTHAGLCIIRNSYICSSVTGRIYGDYYKSTSDQLHIVVDLHLF